MPSTFSILEIGKSALLASRKQMEVTGHNVANAATPGYSRQKVLVEPMIHRQSLFVGVSGVGVRVTDVVRTRDRFIDAVLRGEVAKRASFGVQVDVLEHLQVITAEPSDESIRQTLDSFWGSWLDLSSEPTSQAAKYQTIECGRSLVDMFRHLGDQLDSLQEDIRINMDANVNKVNLLIEQVDILNKDITRSVARNEPVADLLDKRDLLLDEIAELTGATVSHNEKGGAAKVYLNGLPLVDENRTYNLDVVITSEGTTFRWSSIPGEYHVIEDIGGRLGGFREARDQMVGEFKSELEALLKDIVDDINSIHSSGYSTNNTTGLNFFEVNPEDYLASIKVSEELISDCDNLAVAKEEDSLDGFIALEIANRLDGSDRPMEASYIERWTASMGKLGVMGQKADTGLNIQELLVRELENRKSAVSGVSIDEEMANLVREQHAFNAASRVITVADEMLDTIINRMGR